MNTTYQPQQSKLKLVFHFLLLLACVPLHIGLNGGLFALVWLSHRQLVPIGLFVSMLWAGMIVPLITLQLSKYSRRKALFLFVNGLITFITLLGIDCFRLVYDQFNPNHRTSLFDFLWYNLLSLDFSLERLSDELHANIFHLLYYFGGLTLSTFFFYKKDRLFVIQSVPVLDDEDEFMLDSYTSDIDEEEEFIYDDSASHTDDSDYLY